MSRSGFAMTPPTIGFMTEFPAEPVRDTRETDPTSTSRPQDGPMSRLSARELEVLEMISVGMTNAQVAERLGVSVDAVKFHLAALYRKLGVSNRAEAMSTYVGSLGTPLRGVGRVAEAPQLARASTGGGGGGGVDLHLFGRVMWRFKWLVALGLIIAAGLAFLSYQRQTEEYASYATVFVTQNGFPWGRLALPGPVIGESGSGGTASPTDTGPAFADPNRLSSLAILYARLADSDPVRQLMAEEGKIEGRIEAATLLASDNQSDALPLISIAGIASTPEAAITTAQRATTSLVSFIEDQQKANGIPASERVKFQVVKEPDKAKVLSGKSLTLPIVVFLAVMLGVVALAFLLQNLRPPRPGKASAEDGEADSARDETPSSAAVA